VGTFSKKPTFVGKLKQLQFSVGNSKAKRFVVGNNKTKTSVCGFWFLVCYAATQLATQLRQRCIQVLRSIKEARKRLTESNGTPAMDFGCEEIRKRKYTQTKNRTKHTTTTVI